MDITVGEFGPASLPLSTEDYIYLYQPGVVGRKDRKLRYEDLKEQGYLIEDYSTYTKSTILKAGQVVYFSNVCTGHVGISSIVGNGISDVSVLKFQEPVYLEISADLDLSSYTFDTGTQFIIHNTDSSSHDVDFDGVTIQAVAANNIIMAIKLSSFKITYIGGSPEAHPIGSQYIQVASVASNTITVACPTSESPASLFGGTWTELWDTESIFLRTEGTLSDTDRTTGKQEDALQECTGVAGFRDTLGLVDDPDGTSGVFSQGDVATVITASGVSGYFLNFALSGSTSPNPAKTNDNETIVVNRLMIIWKRTA